MRTSKMCTILNPKRLSAPETSRKADQVECGRPSDVSGSVSLELGPRGVCGPNSELRKHKSPYFLNLALAPSPVLYYSYACEAPEHFEMYSDTASPAPTPAFYVFRNRKCSVAICGLVRQQIQRVNALCRNRSGSPPPRLVGSNRRTRSLLSCPARSCLSQSSGPYLLLDGPFRVPASSTRNCCLVSGKWVMRGPPQTCFAEFCRGCSEDDGPHRTPSEREITLQHLSWGLKLGSTI